MAQKKRKFLWITDPWSTLDHSRDTTLRLMQEGLHLGLPQFWCDVKSIRLEHQTVLLEAFPLQEVHPQKRDPDFIFGPRQTVSPESFHSLHYRTDPPVDQAYLHPLQLLATALRGSKTSEMVNPFDVLFQLNEKIEASSIEGLMPPSLVSSQEEALTAFGKTEGLTVLKPLHLAQSIGIELLDWRTPSEIERSRTLLKQVTQEFQTPVLLQRYLAGVKEGETRLWFLDGKLLATIKKHPVQGDFRVNMDRGSRLTPTTLSSIEKKVALKIGRHLKQRKIRLAAIDVIDGYATDFNFTSPGLIPLMEDVLKINLAHLIMNALATS